MPTCLTVAGFVITALSLLVALYAIHDARQARRRTDATLNTIREAVAPLPPVLSWLKSIAPPEIRSAIADMDEAVKRITVSIESQAKVRITPSRSRAPTDDASPPD